MHAARAQRLADVAPVGVGQADVDDQRVGLGLGGTFEELASGCDGRSVEALGAQAAHEHAA